MIQELSTIPTTRRDPLPPFEKISDVLATLCSRWVAAGHRPVALVLANPHGEAFMVHRPELLPHTGLTPETQSSQATTAVDLALLDSMPTRNATP